MGSCVSKCYPTCHPIPCKDPSTSISTAEASPAVLVHPHPLLPGEAAGAASTSPTTAASSLSLCASSGSGSGSGSSSSSSAASSSYLSWDVVVLDPKFKSSDSNRCKPNSYSYRLAAPKRARSVSPLSLSLSARPASPPGSYEQQHNKRPRQNTGRRSTTATQREVLALSQSQARKKKTDSEVSLRRRRLGSTAAALAQVTPDDDLTNPIISMDCFIFL